jgi:hypothetical protein
LPGDFNQDGHTTAADISAMLAALADLNAFKSAHDLSGNGLRSIGDLNASGTLNTARATPQSGGSRLTSFQKPG